MVKNLIFIFLLQFLKNFFSFYSKEITEGFYLPLQFQTGRSHIIVRPILQTFSRQTRQLSAPGGQHCPAIFFKLGSKLIFLLRKCDKIMIVENKSWYWRDSFWKNEMLLLKTLTFYTVLINLLTLFTSQVKIYLLIDGFAFI